MSTMRIERSTAGLATVVLDASGKPINTLHPGLLDEFEEYALALLADRSVRAVVIASGKQDSFVAGADLKLLDTFGAEEAAAEFSRAGNALLQRIAAADKPIVAAVHGAALGGGLEVALACHFIVASDDPATVLGLPEVTLGLLPGGGGTQRLPQRIGLPAALDMMLTGRRVRARRAKRLGLVDALTTAGGIAETAGRAALALADGRLEGRRPLPIATRLAARPPLRQLILARARKQVASKTRGLYPAPLEILECVRIGLARGLAAGLAEESRRFGRLVASAQSRSLVWLFNASQDLKKPIRAAQPRPMRKLGILGAGFMGAGVASVSVRRWPVVVRDIDETTLAAAARTMRAGLDRQIRSGALRRSDADADWSRLHLTLDLDTFVGADLVIEAVFEDLELKRRVLDEVEEIIAPGTVFASNTSALPIRDIAARARHPERVLGMHYFSPVPKMPLLEIVASERTADWAVATAREVGLAQGKTVVVVKDGPGFYTTRILAPYLNEAMLLVEEGARIEIVDTILKDFGFPVGPLALVDEVGVDVAAHVATGLAGKFAHRTTTPSRVPDALVAGGRRGRKSGHGLYLYPKKGRKQPNTAVYDLFGEGPRTTIPTEEIRDRVALTMVNEAVHCLAEGVIASPRDGDVAAVFGLGFPPFRGGPFHHLDAVGAAVVVSRLAELAERHGPRFAPAPLLVAAARDGRRFYSE